MGVGPGAVDCGLDLGFGAVFPVLAHKCRGQALEMPRYCLEMPRQCPQMTRPSAKKWGGVAARVAKDVLSISMARNE